MKAVYAMTREDGAVKVGRSGNPGIRAITLASDTRQAVQVAFHTELRADASAIENTAHKLLAEKRQHGEWFNVTIEEATAAIARAIAIVDGHEEDVTEGVRFRKSATGDVMTKDTVLHIRMSRELKDALVEAAKSEGVSISDLVYRLLTDLCVKAGKLKQPLKDEPK
jgi:hypothetical protein